VLSVASAAGCGSRSGLLGGDGVDARDDGADPEVAAVPPFTPLEPPTELPLQPPPEPELTGCVDRRLSYDTLPPTVLLLIDQSASMEFRFGASTRWDVLRSAIVDPSDGLLSHLDSSVRFGLMLYTSLDGYRGGRCPMLTESSLEVGNADTIRSLYLDSEPLENGDTPTPEAIDAAVARLSALSDGGPHYILLLTDGDPDTCAQPDPQNGGGEALAAASRAYAAGIRLHPIGISNEISRWRIQGLANAAAGKDARLVWGQDADAERPLFASDDRTELAAQLTGVIGDARSCVVELGELVGAVRAGEGRLTLDGQPLVYQAANGWRFRDDDTVEISGAACKSILADGHRLEVFFPCVPAAPRLRPPR
jgi:von Willebrand factor type A domain-containing protein